MVLVLSIGFFAIPAGIFFLLQLLFAPLASSELMWVPALVLQGLAILGFPILLRRWKLSQSDWLLVDLTRVTLRIRGLEHRWVSRRGRDRGQVHAIDRTWPLHELRDEQGPQISVRATTGSLLLGRGADQVRIAGLHLLHPKNAQVFLDHLTHAIEDATERHGQGQAELPDDLGRIQQRAKEPSS